ncbi:MAG: DUF438 domain-containing protein [Christensenellales bacterium]|jgi:DUF438 domain-containing protein
MSEEINNREYRKKVLKNLISQLHDGKSVDDVKEQFAAVFGNVSAEEIAQAEQALIEGGLPVSEVQRLCDVHAAVFKGSIDEIHRTVDPSQTPGHPANTLHRENRAIEALAQKILKHTREGDEASAKAGLERMREIDLHYSKKENLLFPYLEKYGITAPPKVMWGVDDEIRAQLKDLLGDFGKKPLAQLADDIKTVLNKIDEMIFKEEHILMPMMTENLTADEWRTIADDIPEIGYCLIDGAPAFIQPHESMSSKPEAEQQAEKAPDGIILLPTGRLSIDELTRMLDTLPMDITFVGKDDTVKYFSQGTERIFPRTKAVIGRNVSNCHPPASVHIVEELVNDFKAGRKDQEDFWISLGGKYILIRYFAVRDEAGEYMGVLEVTQNIKPLQAITGEKRLVSE